jgi:hypothetical protein
MPAGVMGQARVTLDRWRDRKRDYARWGAARTLDELGELTALWLEGRVGSQPGYEPNCGPDPETEHLVPVLARANRAGFVTDCSQPGQRGVTWWQRAAVEGFCDGDTLRRLRAVCDGARLEVHARRISQCERPMPERWWSPRSRYGGDGGRKVSWSGTAFGSQLYRADIELRYDVCPDEVIDVLCSSWRVTIVDPEIGRDDRLWPALERFARRKD